MSNRVFPARRGSQAPSPLGAGAGGGPQFDSRRLRLEVSLHPWLSLAQLSASLPAPPPCMDQKKKGKQPPRQLDMVQKPPGSLGSRKPAQEGVEGRECKGSVPRERDFKREETEPLLQGLSAKMGTSSRAAWKPSPGRAPRSGSNSSSRENVEEKEDAGSRPGVRLKGWFEWKEMPRG